MGFFSRLFGTEERGTLNDPRVSVSDENIIQFLGLESESSTGEPVTIEKALAVPSVWAAVNFLADTMATLPLHLFRRTDSGNEQITRDPTGLAPTLQEAINDEWSSYKWRRYSYDRHFTGGRQYTYIERNAMGRIINLWPLEPSNMTVRRRDGVVRYHYKDGARPEIIYQPGDIVDLAFMLHPDGINHYSPIMNHKETMALAIAATKYGSRYFNRGGVPPFAIYGPMKSPGAVTRAADDLTRAIEQAARQNKIALSMPAGHELKEIGANPDKAQLVELKRFLVEEIARIYGLPPVFLQDLTHGTFSNTEQQDLHLVKHRIIDLVQQAEQELNLKLFTRRRRNFYVKFNVDALLRGDFRTRMEGYARGIQSAVMSPNEARALEERPPMEGGDELLIQGATVPLGSQPTEPAPSPNPPANDDEPMDDDEEDARSVVQLMEGIRKGLANG